MKRNIKVWKGGGGRLLRIFQIQIVGRRGWSEVVEISLVYTSIMGEGVYKPSILYAKAKVLI